MIEFSGRSEFGPASLSGGSALVGRDGAVVSCDDVSTPMLVVRAGGGAVVLEGLTFWSEREREAPLIVVEPGGRLEVRNCRFVSITGREAINVSDGELEVSDSVFFGPGEAINFTLSREGEGGDADFVVKGCEFLRPDGGDGGIFVRTSGPVIAEISARFAGMAAGVFEGTRELRLVGCSLWGSDVKVNAPRGHVIIGDINIGGPVEGGIRVEGSEAAGGMLLVSNVRTERRVGLRGEGSLINITGAGSFDQVRLRDLELNGGSGTAVRVASDDGAASATLMGARISGWQRGVVVEAGAGAVIEVLARPGGGMVENVLSDNEAAIMLSGAGAVLRAGKGTLRLAENVRGLVLGDGAGGELEGVLVEGSVAEGVVVGDGANINMTSCVVRGNGIGLSIGERASKINLMKNEFDVPGYTQYALLINGQTIDVRGNIWKQLGLPIFGERALDDLIADGDGSEPGSGEAELGIASETGGAVVRWDRTATRRTPGYGNTVFAEREEIERRLGGLQILEYGAGEYPLLRMGDGRSGHYRGMGATRTVLVAEDAAELESLRIEGAELKGGLDWGAGRLELKGVAVGRLEAAAGGEVIRLEDVSTGDLKIVGRSVEFDGLKVAGKFEWSGEGEATLKGKELEAASLRIGGTADVTGGRITGPAEVAVELEDSGTSAVVRLAGLELAGFSRAGVEIAAGDYNRVELINIRMTAGEGTTAAGVMLDEGARTTLMVNGLVGEGLRPGVRLAGSLASGELRGLKLNLPAAFNDVASREAGLLFELKRNGAGQGVSVLGSEISGYDEGVLFAETHGDSTTVTLGNTWPDGANKVVRNGVGIRVASRQALVAFRENSWWSEYRDNGVAMMVEAGAVMVDSAKVVDNQAGIIVRGGMVDLGGGELGSRGGNRLWPQSGAVAVMNDSGWTVWALGNDWGEASVRLGTGASPARGKGEIVTDGEREEQRNHGDTEDHGGFTENF